ncbi:helix-turn-helix domain-containing protein [Thalassobius sp. MITS945101]|uniref:helix-turn-helix domain-containing protein n=1 Tax=Thalassobius sp. MITS945101 TaxID=3096994 RepID=UPI003999B966
MPNTLNPAIQPMDISTLAKRAGLPASTLRYYEERGLIASIGRHGLKRVFPASTLDRLNLITAGRAAGFSLEDLKESLNSSQPTGLNRAALRAQAEVLDQQIARLTALRDGLRHAADCREADPLTCPRFRRLLQIARKRFAPTSK